ncbi:hypothetical protein C3B59_08830 [Cryobacterium zongtaii]|uniref:Uncharacterized protein n=1 Tax=Cryobacterium zongtaii TaxID=1259217 RepID=A0A2S3ZFP8_9MICO|nr:hypothetical protein [Cryobacterium zongtaii]POH65937.1 hypothetical protein C3B59_08830 [Cryobacterium zongtaii]
MSKNKSDEPRDEFDRIQIPEFLARPFERLAGGPGVGTPIRPSPRDRSDGNTTVDGDTDADLPEDLDDTEPAPRQWWAGYKGKLLLYGAGTLVMVFLQSRG